jgi:hypothetical protein
MTAGAALSAAASEFPASGNTAVVPPVLNETVTPPVPVVVVDFAVDPPVLIELPLPPVLVVAVDFAEGLLSLLQAHAMVAI